MKRFFCIVLALTLVLPLSLTVFAADKDVVSIAVTVPVPIAGKTWAEAEEEKTEIFVVEGEGTKLLNAPLEFSISQTEWQEAATETVLKTGDTFVAGRMYRVTVTILFNVECTVTGETKSTINGEDAALSNAGDPGGQIDLVREIVCTPGDITPKVTLTVTGNKTKEYDGEPLVLSALTEEVDGVAYQYAWFHDGVRMDGKTENKLSLRNVRDSGKYYCKVTAYLEADPDKTEYATSTPAHTITITPHTVTIVLEDAEKNATDPDPALTYSVLGELYDPLVGRPERVAGEDVGQYAIQIGTLGFAEDVADNYQILAHQGTFTIVQTGELTLSGVAEIADLSYIQGQKGAKIRASASRGAIPEGGLLSLSTAPEAARTALAAFLEEELLKSFSVQITDAAGKNAALPDGARLRLQIPLTEEEAKGIDLVTIRAALYTDDCMELEPEVVVTGGVTYLAVETETLGAIALSRGKLRAAAVSETTDPGPREASPVLWVLIAVLSLLAVGAIVFTIIWMRKNAPAAKKPGAPKPPKTAPKSSVLPKGDPKTPSSAAPTAPDDDVKIFPDPAAPKAAENGDAAKKEEKGPRVISFEDLED